MWMTRGLSEVHALSKWTQGLLEIPYVFVYYFAGLSNKFVWEEVTVMIDQPITTNPPILLLLTIHRLGQNTAESDYVISSPVWFVF